MTDKFRVIIATVTDFSNYELLKNKCDEFLQDKIAKGTVVVCGSSKGTFSLGKRYAKENGYMLEVFTADWEKYGKDAGDIRDFQMVSSADALIAFWDGESKEGKRKIDFVQDYLAGDKYFKTHQPGQNLNRARVQFRLCESIEAREGSIRKMLKRL